MRKSVTLTIDGIERDVFHRDHVTVKARAVGGPLYYLPVPIDDAQHYHVGDGLLVTIECWPIADVVTASGRSITSLEEMRR